MTNPANPGDLAAWARELGFSVDLLALNRKGVVDPSQLAWFGGSIFRDILMSVVILAAAMATALLVKPWWRWLACIVEIALVSFFLVRGIDSVRDRVHPEVLHTDGKPVYSAGVRQSFWIKIGAHDFPLAGGPRDEDRMRTLLDPKNTYRLYYLRHTGRPLTVEPVDAQP
jgi:hypothetical protein